jgi:transcription elongation GreA/GreB family factor
LEDFMHLHSQRSRGRRKPQAQVGIGSTITIRDVVTDEREVYTLVRPDDADINLNRLSSFSPLGKAVGDRRAGEVVEIDAPGGILRYEIEAVLGPPDEQSVESDGERHEAAAEVA